MKWVVALVALMPFAMCAMQSPLHVPKDSDLKHVAELLADIKTAHRISHAQMAHFLAHRHSSIALMQERIAAVHKLLENCQTKLNAIQLAAQNLPGQDSLIG